MIEPRSFESPKLQSLISILMDWLNDELADYRIIVQDIEEDLYDGQVNKILKSIKRLLKHIIFSRSFKS